MRGFLWIMFAIPILSIAQALWDRFRERHTVRMGPDAAFAIPRWFNWAEGEGLNGTEYCHIRAFHMRIPWVRQWRRSSTLANYRLGYVEGWHWLLIGRIRVFGGSRPGVFWSHEWIACEGCVEVPLEESWRK